MNSSGTANVPCPAEDILPDPVAVKGAESVIADITAQAVGSDREKIPTMGNQRTSGDIDARVALAQDRTTAPTELYELASDPSARVRAAVAARPDAPAEAL